MFRMFSLATLILTATWAIAAPIPVNCDAGQSLGRTLSKLDKGSPVTITVTGTCTEGVRIDGFEGLTIRGTQGATLQQPSTDSKTGQIYLLAIMGSRDVTISGLALHSLPSAFSSVAIGDGSTDIQLRNLSIDGPWGILAFGASQVAIAKVNIMMSSGYSAIAAWDKSDVHMQDCSLRRTSDSNWYAGIFASTGHVTVQGTTIRDMQQSIVVDANGTVDLVYFDNSTPNSDVLISNPASTNFNSVRVDNGSSLNVTSAKLQITSAGQSWGADTGGILVTDGSTLNANTNLVIGGSLGQGVVVANNSHARLGGSTITGGSHGGLVVVNMSTATVDNGTSSTISGNGTDLFCDAQSQIAGTRNILGATTVQCNNVLQDIYPSLP